MDCIILLFISPLKLLSSFNPVIIKNTHFFGLKNRFNLIIEILYYISYIIYQILFNYTINQVFYTIYITNKINS